VYASTQAEIPEQFKNADDKEFIKGTISSVTEYGAFVTIAEGVDGLVHVSQLSEDRVDKVDKFRRLEKYKY
jgi:small subunit ribosomal protein S1